MNKINKINENIIKENILKNCVSKKEDIENAIKARINALKVAENENSSENEIAEANALAKKLELRLNYTVTAIVTVVENGNRDAFAQKKICADAQRKLGFAFNNANQNIKNAIYLDKVAIAAGLKCCEATDINEAEEKAEKAAIAAADAYNNLTEDEKIIFNNIIEAKAEAQEIWAKAKNNFANKVGLDLNESVKGFVESSILKIDAKSTSIGTRVPVKYKKVNGKIRDIRLLNE